MFEVARLERLVWVFVCCVTCDHTSPSNHPDPRKIVRSHGATSSGCQVRGTEAVGSQWLERHAHPGTDHFRCTHLFA